jgi:hypothetical protein
MWNSGCVKYKRTRFVIASSLVRNKQHYALFTKNIIIHLCLGKKVISKKKQKKCVTAGSNMSRRNTGALSPYLSCIINYICVNVWELRENCHVLETFFFGTWRDLPYAFKNSNELSPYTVEVSRCYRPLHIRNLLKTVWGSNPIGVCALLYPSCLSCTTLRMSNSRFTVWLVQKNPTIASVGEMMRKNERKTRKCNKYVSLFTYSSRTDDNYSYSLQKLL